MISDIKIFDNTFCITEGEPSTDSHFNIVNKIQQVVCQRLKYDNSAQEPSIDLSESELLDKLSKTTAYIRNQYTHTQPQINDNGCLSKIHNTNNNEIIEICNSIEELLSTFTLNFLPLPREVIGLIISHLDFSDILTLRLVNTKTNELVTLLKLDIPIAKSYGYYTDSYFKSQLYIQLLSKAVNQLIQCDCLPEKYLVPYENSLSNQNSLAIQNTRINTIQNQDKDPSRYNIWATLNNAIKQNCHLDAAFMFEYKKVFSIDPPEFQTAIRSLFQIGVWTCRTGHPIIHEIIQTRNIEHLEVVLDCGAQEVINRYYSSNIHSALYLRYPLINAIEINSPKSVELLMKRGARYDVQNDPYLGSPLIIAAEAQKTEVCKVLLKNNAVENELRVGINAILSIALETNNIELGKLLLDRNVQATIDNFDSNGWTLLHHAANKNSQEFVELFLQLGASPNALTNNRTINKKKTPLQMATDPTVITILINYGATILDFFDRIDLQMAILNSTRPESPIRVKESIINQLITNTDKNGWSLLHVSIQKNKPSATHVLLELGADPNIRDLKNEWPPLMYAIKSENIEIVEMLIKKRADVNALCFDINNSSILRLSAPVRDQIRRELQAEGSSSSFKARSNGKSLLVYAKESKNKKIIALMNQTYDQS